MKLIQTDNVIKNCFSVSHSINYIIQSENCKNKQLIPLPEWVHSIKHCVFLSLKVFTEKWGMNEQIIGKLHRIFPNLFCANSQ